MTYKQWLLFMIQPSSHADIAAAKALRYMLQVNTIFFFFFQIFSHQKEPFLPFRNRLVIPKRCSFGTPPNSQVQLKVPKRYHFGKKPGGRFRSPKRLTVLELLKRPFFVDTFSETVPFRNRLITILEFFER